MLHQENDKTAQTFLNSLEISLLKDRELFLRKRELGDKLNILLGNCIAPLRGEMLPFNEIIPFEVYSSQPKITKGENYLGFPWTILDYPRFFDKKAIFAIRILCWWGNSFSITLHLSGVYAEKYGARFFSNWDKLRESDLLICINEDPWQHHQEPDNYIKIRECSSDYSNWEAMVEKSGFIKICKVFPLEKWNELPQITTETTRFIFNLMFEESQKLPSKSLNFCT